MDRIEGNHWIQVQECYFICLWALAMHLTWKLKLGAVVSQSCIAKFSARGGGEEGGRAPNTSTHRYITEYRTCKWQFRASLFAPSLLNFFLPQTSTSARLVYLFPATKQAPATPPTTAELSSSSHTSTANPGTRERVLINLIHRSPPTPISTYIPTNQISKTCAKNHQLPKTPPCVPSCHDNRTESPARKIKKEHTSLGLYMFEQAPSHTHQTHLNLLPAGVQVGVVAGYVCMCVLPQIQPPLTLARKKGATSRARHVIPALPARRSPKSKGYCLTPHPPPQTCISAVQVGLENTHTVRT